MTAATLPHSVTDTLGSFFGVVIRGRSYLNAVYNLLAFPLGVAYFVFLTVGLGLGFGLALIWIGFLILAVVLIFSVGLSAFERVQAVYLLDARIQAVEVPAKNDPGFVEWARQLAINRVTWTGPIFLFLKFPLGVLSFTFAITSLSLSLALLGAPLYYRWSPPDFFYWYADTLPEALICSAVGALLFIVTLHALNGLAFIWRELATVTLGERIRDAEPSQTTLPSREALPPAETDGPDSPVL